MADDLKRVGLRFTADGAVDFKNSLKDISAATKENYTELKLAQSQYDKNTSSAQKLADKQKYLQGQTDLYKQKVQLLNTQLEEMEKAEQRDETAIRKKRTEINEAQTKLNGYEQSLEEVTKQVKNHSAELKDWGDKIQTVGGKIESVGNKVGSVGETLTKNVTVPIVAAAGASVAAWKEVDSAMDIITKKTGASGEALDDMQKRAKNIAETIPTSFESAANAVGEVSTRFGLTGDALEALSSEFVKFAELNDTDVTSSVDSVQAAMAAFGIDANHATDVLDILTKASQDTGTSVDTLSSDLTTNATALQEMGFGLSESVGFMANLNKNGVDASTVMGGLKKAFVNATKEGKTMDQAMSELQGAIMGAKTDTEAAQIAMELFGTKAGGTIAKQMRDGKLSFDESANSVKEWGGAVSNTFEETLDPLDSMQTTMNTLKDLGAEIVEAGAPLLVEAMKALRDVVQDLKKKWESLTPEQQLAIEKFAGIAAAVGPVLLGVGKVTAKFGGFIATIGNVVTALGGGGGLAGVLAAGGPVIIAIMAVIAAVVLLIANWDKVKAAAKKLGETLKNAWTGIKQTATQIWNGITTTISGAWEKIKNTASNTAERVRNTVSQKFTQLRSGMSSLWKGMQSTASSAWDGLYNKVSGVMQRVWTFVSNIAGRLRGIFNFHWSLPKIKLPHFSWDWLKIGTFKLPRIRVQWYKRAYDTAAYYNSPTVRADGRGFGDGAGGEFAVGERHLRSTVSSAVNNGAILSRMDDVIDAIATLSDRMARMQLVLDTGQTIGALAPAMGSEMAINTKRNR